jgi:hypothetical protein
MTFNTWKWGFYFSLTLFGRRFACGAERSAIPGHWEDSFVKWQRGPWIAAWALR